MSLAHSIAMLVLICLVSEGPNGVQSQRSPVCNNVPHGQFVRGHQSCRAYNYCANNVAYPGECASQHNFNAISQTCDDADRVNCNQCSPQGLLQMPDPKDCGKFYRCLNGVRTLQQCPAGLKFDSSIGDCNFDMFGECQPVETLCAPFGFTGAVYIGNPNDCHSYFMCFNGLEQKMLCGPFLYYNPLRGLCEQNVYACQSNGALIPVPQAPPQLPQVELPRCDMYISMGLVFISNPNDCTSYFNCNNGTLSNHVCANSTFFNPITTKCQATCQGSSHSILQTPPPTTIAPTTTRSNATTTRAAATTTRAAATTTRAATTGAASRLGFDSSDPCLNSNGYNSVPGSCSRYTYCLIGYVMFEQECPETMYFSESDGPCVLHRPSGC